MTRRRTSRAHPADMKRQLAYHDLLPLKVEQLQALGKKIKFPLTPFQCKQTTVSQWVKHQDANEKLQIDWSVVWKLVHRGMTGGSALEQAVADLVRLRDMVVPDDVIASTPLVSSNDVPPQNSEQAASESSSSYLYRTSSIYRTRDRRLIGKGAVPKAAASLPCWRRVLGTPSNARACEHLVGSHVHHKPLLFATTRPSPQLIPMSFLYGGLNTPPGSPQKQSRHYDPSPCQLRHCVTSPGKEPTRANRRCQQHACKPCCQMHLTRRVRSENLTRLYCQVHRHEALGADTQVTQPPNFTAAADPTTLGPTPTVSPTRPIAPPGQSKNVDRTALGRSAGPVLVRLYSQNGLNTESLGAHATRRPLTKPQDNKAAGLAKQQGRMIWVRTWNFDGTQKAAARAVHIPKTSQGFYDIYDDPRTCTDLGILQRGQPFWAWKVVRAQENHPGGAQWVEMCQPLPVTMGSEVDLTVARNYFPSPPPLLDQSPTPADTQSAIRQLTQVEETLSEPPRKRVRLDITVPQPISNDVPINPSAPQAPVQMASPAYATSAPACGLPTSGKAYMP
ncbi:hypothetical protein BDZ89DRAFT_1048848 [Hymenopellis radicata]|nr:hypothetical protein BDZ89DRAFT_1048848 [Hymenopellis radicata]